MRNIRISDEVWDAIAKEGKFRETEDDVLRRVFKIPKRTKQGKTSRQRLATRPMSEQIIGGKLVVLFKDDHTSKNWPLPQQDDKQEIRRIRDEAVQFALDNGASIGQANAVKKKLTDEGYYVR